MLFSSNFLCGTFKFAKNVNNDGRQRDLIRSKRSNFKCKGRRKTGSLCFTLFSLCSVMFASQKLTLAFTPVLMKRIQKSFSVSSCVANKTKTGVASEKIENRFGFTKIDPTRKQKKVDDVFNAVADTYDVMNDAMSFGLHRIWKDIFMQRLSPTPGTRLLDVAGGTGDIAFRFLKYLEKEDPPPAVTVADINRKMLEVGRERSSKLGHRADRIEWVECNAEELPFDGDTYDAYTIAFGIRNVTRIERVLREAHRVLKPGGRFLCLEFSRVDSNLQWLYDQYSFQVIPVMGEVIAGDWKAYQYLVESIRNFPDQEEFKELIEQAGFRMVTYENLTFGVVAVHSGFKL